MFRLLLPLFFLQLLSIQASAESIDTLSIRRHLQQLIATEKPRNYRNPEVLDYVANYIYQEFKQYADTVYYQPYTVQGVTYKNVICTFGSQHKETIVVGAHYDVCGDQDGADDNASGTVGLLELARLLKDKPLQYKIELVAYTLEEPPFFRTEYMGSYVHAKALKESGQPVYGMISLEMIGYFDDTKGSQEYPVGFLTLLYGKLGNYITLVNKLHKGKFSRKFSRQFTRQNLIKTKKFNAPAKLPGIDFSDHLNYWHFGYSALMITDTAFFRNKNYHKNTDTLETLDLKRMALTIETVFRTLIDLS